MNMFSNTVVFGDSLSDPGNTPLGQFTDTDVWATQLDIGATNRRNFAVGGARAIPNAATSDFAEQVTQFAQAQPRLPDYSQAVVWFGGNDLLNLTNPAEIGLAVSSITTGILNLSANFGIDRFVIPGLADFSTIPAAFGDPTAQALSLAFNQSLIDSIALLSAFGIDARYVDIAAVLASAQASGDFPNPGVCVGTGDCDGFLFYDPIHPTGAAHALLAEAISAELAPVPLPAGGALVLTGLFAFGALRWRQSQAA